MISKSLAILAAPVLVLGLAACTNKGNNAAMDNTRDDRAMRNVSYNGTNDQRYHRGVVTDDYTPNARYRYQNRLVGVNISAADTSKSSANYPHTRAMLVQEAKYKEVPIDPSDTAGIDAGPFVQGQIPFGGQNQGAAAGNQNSSAPSSQTDTSQGAGNQADNAADQGQMNQQAKSAPQQQNQTNNGNASIGKTARQVIDLTNQQRKKNGLPALKADTELSGVAQKKALDMDQNHYFSHTSPTYGSPFDMMRDFGVSYKTAGENIAEGQPTAKEVVNAWMHSEGHRKNILNPNFTHIGVGFDNNGNYWSQMFIGK